MKRETVNQLSESPISLAALEEGDDSAAFRAVVEEMRLRGLVAWVPAPLGGAEKWEALDLPTAGLLDSLKLPDS